MNTDKLIAYQSRKAETSVIWILFLFLGWSYGSLDKMGMQILFYVTLGGLGVWALIRLFTLNGAIKAYNRKIAEQIGLESHELEMLNLV